MAKKSIRSTAKSGKTRKASAARKATTKKSAKIEKSESAEPDTAEVPVDRRRKVERRDRDDRRQCDVAVASDQRKLKRREKVTRRRQIDPTTCERDYSTEEIEFMAALDHYKRKSGRMFPTCSEILEVLGGLGYQKVKPQAQPETAIAPPFSPATDIPLTSETSPNQV